MSDWALLAPQSGAARAATGGECVGERGCGPGNHECTSREGQPRGSVSGSPALQGKLLSSYGVLVIVHVSPRPGLWTALNRSEFIPHHSASETDTKRATEEP